MYLYIYIYIYTSISILLHKTGEFVWLDVLISVRLELKEIFVLVISTWRRKRSHRQQLVLHNIYVKKILWQGPDDDIFFCSNQISFTFYPAHSRVGRGNLELRYSVAHFPLNSWGIACWVAKLIATFCLDTEDLKN